uniref:HTH CENPB-type domain-containing protein n=1 Tax=Anopheles minimus TaxID=112268 RepID=A0A182VSM6_9DIPT
MTASHRFQEDVLKQCMRSIQEQNLSVYSASKKFGIPPSKCRYCLSNHWKNKPTPGPNTCQIVQWLQQMQHRGFPVSRKTLLTKVASFLKANNRQTTFKNNQPGRKWLALFLRRNKNLSFRKPETITSASSRISENDIRSWFENITNWLTMNNFIQFLHDPSRVFNGDETSFNLHSKTKEVIVVKGSKNVYEIEQASGRQNVTVMFTFSADGNVVHPHVILPGKRIRKEIAQGFPANWGLGQSERGWMDTNNFREYIIKVFHPWLVARGVQCPVILFLDGHSSHKSIEVADVCQLLGIILISLYPNKTHIIQPADVAVFKPLKEKWRDLLRQTFPLKHFGPVLQDAVMFGIKAESIQNGFRVCGFYPFGPENVDFSKCLNVPEQNNSTNRIQEPGTQSVSSPQISVPPIQNPSQNHLTQALGNNSYTYFENTSSQNETH